MITLKTLAEATEQQVFDQVAQHLLSQHEKSIIPNGGCVYRSNHNRKCAAGCLISDEEYTPAFDTPHSDEYGTSWDCLISRELVPTAHRELIAELQKCHDLDTPEFWPVALKGIAVRFKLNTNVLGEK